MEIKLSPDFANILYAFVTLRLAQKSEFFDSNNRWFTYFTLKLLNSSSIDSLLHLHRIILCIVLPNVKRRLFRNRRHFKCSSSKAPLRLLLKNQHKRYTWFLNGPFGLLTYDELRLWTLNFDDNKLEPFGEVQVGN